MATVTLWNNGFISDRKEYDTFNDAEKEFKRQARNAWRRKSAYNQVQYMLTYKMSWRDQGGHYWLELA